jgi:hypothetical protein
MRQDLINAPPRHHVAAKEHADGLGVVHFHFSSFIVHRSFFIAGSASFRNDK